MRYWLVWLCLLPGIAAAQGGEQSSLLARIGFDQHQGRQLPLDLTFRDAAGRSRTLSGLLAGDRPVILVPAYYRCPNLCSVTLETLAQNLPKTGLTAGQDYRVVVYSIDPGETPTEAAGKKADLARRLPRAGIEPGWTLLSGDRDSVARLSRSIGFRAEYDAALDQFAHAAGIVLLTPEGRIARYLFGMALPPRDLRLGLVEAGQGSIGSPVDRLLLLCYDYNPRTGQYSLLVMKSLRLAGLATLVLLGGGIVWLVWRERRSRRSRRESVS